MAGCLIPFKMNGNLWQKIITDIPWEILQILSFPDIELKRSVISLNGQFPGSGMNFLMLTELKVSKVNLPSLFVSNDICLAYWIMVAHNLTVMFAIGIKITALLYSSTFCLLYFLLWLLYNKPCLWYSWNNHPETCPKTNNLPRPTIFPILPQPISSILDICL